MKKLATLAIALILPMLFVSVPTQAAPAVPPIPECTTAEAQAKLVNLIRDTKTLCTVNPKDRVKTQNKLLKHLYQAQEELCKGTVKHQYHAAKDVYEYDKELRNLYWKGKISCHVDSGIANLDESALQLLVCIVDIYYPGSDYDPYINGVITCPGPH